MQHKESAHPVPPTGYDKYDYSKFWEERNYENYADEIAVKRLFAQIDGPHKKIIDVGGGMGRMIPMYKNLWKEFVILDSSKKQLDDIKAEYLKENITTIHSLADHMNIEDGTCDAMLSVRLFHYIKNPDDVIHEMNRVLAPGGYLVLEIPNKFHFKNRILSIFKKNTKNITSENPVDIAELHKDVTFVNHHPATIKKLLEKNNFKIINILSVSNFRSQTLKKIFPAKFLAGVEKHLQKPLASAWFGPSIYFLAQKIK